ncbi:DHHC zinc finger domain containing protein [Entamoeba histolytica HM-1:IMSS-B]|uniref:Palmitoyltransferase n=6 Tax=Entamoeba histolytica TaxID=5759 RepID=C4LYP6_ENTH1|nr:hypothetical protein EHI_004220 [Entamoeba histolytica HM-1:IMSS]EMD46188.1 Rap GTPase-activating protein, putative [Entamoeba histolytica KU27]EMH74032.1 DHHC zinc finger domain containing protein [Entamoeba histolytica HM-1:IMSS-B]EMS15552.1 rap GTPase-activating protein, putative [Entamoeba histolytica HM-3:IMSS]ENY65692.1 rap GTPase-activating protein, putative [Entamoeba histolytica HM-1:IMSS-A]GAT93953.1 hypothetical protein conserved domain containing [Entamoeba histolytica]|eukprot:XP_650202.1 hypothetical protein EHI_004220 [Entamoeba histolytica HM-1:IMSS]
MEDSQNNVIDEPVQPEGFTEETSVKKHILFHKNHRQKHNYDPQRTECQNHISHIGINFAFIISGVVFIFQVIELGLYVWYISLLLLILFIPLYILGTTSYNRCVQVKEKLYVPLNHYVEGENECSICHCTKPERSHHCSRCGRCVLKMDHHCPFVGSCIGYANHKYFILTLFYTFILCTLLFVLTIFILYIVIEKIISKESFKFEEIFLPFHAIQIFISIYFIFVTFLMLCQQIYHIIQNETGIELKQNKSGWTSCRKNKQVNRFNVGFKKNFKEVFGDSWIYSFLPVWTTKGDGYSFPTNNSFNDTL